MDKHERKPVVAGKFYPASATELKKQISGFIDLKAERLNAIACMLPHAGYVYSGRVASQTICRVNLPERIILLGPNHTGYGAQFSIMTKGSWQTPLGELKIDSDLAESILKHSSHLKEDALAHTYEHSLEVELPILQYFKSNFQIVPICILSDALDILQEISQAIVAALKESDASNSSLIIASSDMTHYESQGEAEKKDRQAIQCILDLDVEGLKQKVQGLNISMCGYAPVSVMLSAAKLLGAKDAKLVKYQTSGDVTGDKSSVVGYAGIIIY